MTATLRPGRILLGWLGLACLLSSCASLPDSSGGNGRPDSLHLGGRTPVVVFEGGIGEGKNTWDRVFPAVDGFTSAFAYSRPGYAGGGPVRSERDGENVVRELRTRLAAEGLPPPYVLVGHSIGGLYVELFAKLYPAEVAGVVLVDPTPVDHGERLQKELPAKANLVRALGVLQGNSVQGAEQRGVDATSREWHAAGPFPHCPMILLTGVKAGFLEDADMIAYKERAHAELLKLWPGAEGRRVASGHFIQRDKPEEVIAAVKEVVERARARMSAGKGSGTR